MKHLIFTITSILFSIGVFSQQFDFYLNNSSEQNLVDVFENANSYDFVGRQRVNNTLVPYRLKISKTGVFISDSLYSNDLNSMFTSIINWKDYELVTQAGVRKGDSSCVILIDSLGFNRIIQLKDGDKQFFAEHFKQLDDSIFVALGYFYDSTPFPNAGLWVVNMLDTSMNKFVNLSDPQNPGLENVFDIIRFNNKYIVTAFGTNAGPLVSWGSSAEIIQLDHNFQVDTAFDISHSGYTFGYRMFAYNASLVKIDEEKFMVASRAGNPRGTSMQNADDLAAIVMDTNYNELSLNFYGLPDSNFVEGPKVLSRYDTLPYVFLGGTEKFVVTVGGYGQDTTLFMLTKADLMGNEIWTRYYSNNTYLFLYKVLATSDGGAIMFGLSYDPAGPDGFEQDVWIVKVDSNGNYQTTGIADQQIPSTDFVFYPNPVGGEVHFRQVNQLRNYNLELFDVSGKKVLERKLSSSDETINTVNLNSGTFIYHLTDQKGNYAIGKLIKK